MVLNFGNISFAVHSLCQSNKKKDSCQPTRAHRPIALYFIHFSLSPSRSRSLGQLRITYYNVVVAYAKRYICDKQQELPLSLALTPDWPIAIPPSHAKRSALPTYQHRAQGALSYYEFSLAKIRNIPHN